MSRAGTAEPPDLGFVGVDDGRLQKIGGAPGTAGQPVAEEPAGAGLGAGHGQTAGLEGRPHDIGQVRAVARIDPRSDPPNERPLQAVEDRGRRLRRSRPLIGQPDRQVAGRSEGGHGDLGRDERVEGFEPRLHGRFAQAREADDAAGHQTAAEAGQARADMVLEHRPDLPGRAGQEGDPAAPVVEPQPGSRAVGIGQDLGALDDVALLEVRGRHGPAVAAETLPDLAADGRVEDELPAEDPGQRLAGPVVLGRAEAAHAEDEAGPAEGRPQGPGQVAGVVADDRLEGDVEADGVQAGRQIQGIRVLEVRGQELRADGDDLYLHGFSGLRRRAGPGGRERPPRGPRRRRRP